MALPVPQDGMNDMVILENDRIGPVLPAADWRLANGRKLLLGRTEIRFNLRFGHAFRRNLDGGIALTCQRDPEFFGDYGAGRQ